MASEDAPLDQETFDRSWPKTSAKGTDRRVAEGRARRRAVSRATSRRNPERKPRTRPRPGPRPPAGAARLPHRGRRPGRAPRRRPVARRRRRGRTTAAARRRRCPRATSRRRRRARADKHRLLALVPPEGIQRVEREQGDRVNMWPHLLIEEFVAHADPVRRRCWSSRRSSTRRCASSRTRTSRRTRRRPPGTSWACRSCCATSTRWWPASSIPTFILVGPGGGPLRRPQPQRQARRPQGRHHDVHDACSCSARSLTIIGCFFRGPGYNWIWPWAQGVFFEL